MTRRRATSVECVPNLAPMVDVIMVLLVFFLLGATLDLAQRGVLQTSLDPSSGPSPGQAVAVQSLLIRIGLGDVDNGASASIVVMDRRLPSGDFEGLFKLLDSQRIAGIDTKNPVVIGAETSVRWKYVVKAMDAAVRAKFTNVQFAVSFRPGAVSPP
jgi:biopolymer transport protein ExbD